MDFSLKRWGAHFCPPPIWAAKNACFLPPFQVFGHVAHMFFRFLLHRFRVFLHDFCIFSHFFVKFSACANANWQISGVITSIISELAKVQSPNKNGKFFAICKTFACSFKAFALTGRQVCYPQKPRAMPWAKSFCPFRACCLQFFFLSGRAACSFFPFRACCSVKLSVCDISKQIEWGIPILP